MKIKTIKYIVIRLLIGAPLQGVCFAGPATWVQRPAPSEPPRPRTVTIAFFGHPTKQPYAGPKEIGATRLFNAGQGVVSVPY
jgi:hypothetical protein